MIDYNFNALISLHRYLPKQSFYDKVMISPLPSDSTIDNLWERMKKVVQETLKLNLNEVLDLLKSDIIMSVYTSLVYSTSSELDRQTILEALKSSDPALLNPDSAQSISSNISHKKANMRDSFEPCNISVLLSGQQFDNNATQYLRQFWSAENKIKCFHSVHFYDYIRQQAYWPYSPSNLNGMSFFDYFKGIREMTHCEACYHSNDSDSSDLESDFSAYIFEQLFFPVSFIQNVCLHLSVFDQLCTDSKDESSIRLMQALTLLRPLFKLPHHLWDYVSGNYSDALINFIKKPNDIHATGRMKMEMGIVFYYGNYIFPLLKILMGICLHSHCTSDLGEAKELLETYISENISSFDYAACFRQKMRDVADVTYSEYFKKGVPLDLQGNYLLQTPSGNLKDKEAPKGNDKKRGNQQLRSYEINFTHNFFCNWEYPDFFQGCALGYAMMNNLLQYQFNAISFYLDQFKETVSSYQTYNYLCVLAKEFNFPPGMTIQN